MVWALTAVLSKSRPSSRLKRNWKITLPSCLRWIEVRTVILFDGDVRQFNIVASCFARVRYLSSAGGMHSPGRAILTPMNYWRAFQVTLAWSILAVLTAPSFSETAVAQTPAKKTPSKHTKPDTWKKSKECADQAEKVITDWDDTAVFWRNHYSPKYNQCFLLISRQIDT